jgi:prepilin-type N-terminal cleavage/methylation domain-containing protein
MRAGIKKDRAFTLVETVVAVAVAAVVTLFLSRLLLGGMQISRAGSDHLTSLNAGDIIFSQLIDDLKRTRRIVAEDLGSGLLELEIMDDYQGSGRPALSSVKYLFDSSRGAISRTQAGQRPHQLFKDRWLELRFARVTVPPAARIGAVVELMVGNRQEPKNLHQFKRFVYLESLRENIGKNSSYQPLEF